VAVRQTRESKDSQACSLATASKERIRVTSFGSYSLFTMLIMYWHLLKPQAVLRPLAKHAEETNPLRDNAVQRLMLR